MLITEMEKEIAEIKEGRKKKHGLTTTVSPKKLRCVRQRKIVMQDIMIGLSDNHQIRCNKICRLETLFAFP